MTSQEKTNVIHTLCEMGLEANSTGKRQETIALSNAVAGLVKYWRNKNK